MSDRICTIEGCERPFYARAICRPHYMQWWATRPPTRRNNRDVLERLAEHSSYVVTTRSAEIGDCLVWTRRFTKLGYGAIKIGKHQMTAHRAAWIARYGEPPPETPCVLHHCDNPPCWRDDHLFIGTHADNMADMAAKGRASNQWTAVAPRAP